MTRLYNFCAGPAALPLPVLEQARDEITDWHGKGLSIMEMSHRSKEFVAVAAQAEQDLRDLLKIPANYKVLFMQGGAHSQFSMVPMNLLRGGKKANYIVTGQWSKMVVGIDKRYAVVHISASIYGNNFTSILTQHALYLSPDAAFFHYCPNVTFGGVIFDYVPD